MWETRQVELVLRLPTELAADVEEVREADPEFLGKAIRYALARRIVFEELRDSMEVSPPEVSPPEFSPPEFSPPRGS